MRVSDRRLINHLMDPKNNITETDGVVDVFGAKQEIIT
jgi:hypothetical protein